MSTDLPELQYQKRPPRHRKWVRRIVPVVIVAVGLAVTKPLLMWEVRRYQLVRLYDACCRVTPRPIASFTPGYEDWYALNWRLGTNLNGVGTLFLDELHAPGGSARFLVGVDAAGITGGATTGVQVRVRTISRGSPLAFPSYRHVSDQTVELLPYRSTFKIHGGHRDKNDATHFTITYQADSQTGTIDGWLKEDGTVILEPRSDATAPAPPSPGRSR
jgi:hypothetical protein